MKDIQKLKEFICDIGSRLYKRGYAAANDGNISVRLGENRFLITPTGESKGFMTPEMMVEIDGDCNVVNGLYKASSEAKMHIRVYQGRPDVHAVVHAHPPYATAWAIAGMPLNKKYLPETVLLLGEIPVAKYGTPGTFEIPDSIVPHLKGSGGLLLENHGALTYGKDLKEAYFRMETLEFYAYISHLAPQIEGCKEISPENIKKLEEIKRGMQ